MAMNHFLKKPLAEEALKRSLFVIIGISFILLARLFYIQVIDHDRYQTQALNNRLELEPIIPVRGLIYDRNGEILAENIPGYALAIVPEQTDNISTLLISLKQYLKISEDEIKTFNKRLNQHAKFEPVMLKAKITETEMATISSHGMSLHGIRIVPYLQRNYPKGKIMAPVLGYVGQVNEQERAVLDAINYRGTQWVGKTGFEKHAEQALHGKTGYRAIENNALGRSVRRLNEHGAIAGKSFVLSIDSHLQQVAYDVIGNEHGAIVAIDPGTGEVLAMVSKPTFDPNGFSQGLDTDMYTALQKQGGNPMVNRALHGLYSQGSTIKPFVALAGLESGVINQKTSIDDPGHFQLPNTKHLYRDWLPQGHGKVNAAKALVVSCDVFFYQLSVKLGMAKMKTMLEDFGYGHPTGIELPNEPAGIVPSPNWKFSQKGLPWYTGDTILSAIGQGYMLATPLQLAQATAVLAQRGHRFKPTLIHQTIDAEGNKIAHNHIKLPPLNLRYPSNWTYLAHAMNQVVISTNPKGTGYRFGTDTPYSVAAKTGTVQVFRPKDGIFVPQSQLPKKLRDHALFIAYAPINHPKIAVAVIIEHASSTKSAQAARRVVDAYLLRRHHD